MRQAATLLVGIGCLGTSLALGSPGAWGATSCTVTPTGAAFSSYDPSSTIASTTTATVSVSCQATVALTVPVTVTMSSGASGKVASRYMTNGSATLSYQIYSDTLHTTVWGDGTGGSSTVSASLVLPVLTLLATTSINAYGLIPAGQLVTPGSYSDTILVTVTY